MLISGAIELARCCHPSDPIGFSQDLGRQVGRAWAPASQTGRTKAKRGAEARMQLLDSKSSFQFSPTHFTDGFSVTVSRWLLKIPFTR